MTIVILVDGHGSAMPLQKLGRHAGLPLQKPTRFQMVIY
jgi:hypothetical protein